MVVPVNDRLTVTTRYTLVVVTSVEFQGHDEEGATTHPFGHVGYGSTILFGYDTKDMVRLPETYFSPSDHKVNRSECTLKSF